MENTNRQYDAVLAACRKIFDSKTSDYGTSWRVLRTISIADQIFIKAKRIRTIQENKSQQVADNIASEFAGILNYAIICNILLTLPAAADNELPAAKALSLYDEQAAAAKKLMQQKNHDYGEAWRDMRISSITDLILMKLLRVKQIEDNKGQTLASEGVIANYQDMLNYAVFALIKLSPPTPPKESFRT